MQRRGALELSISAIVIIILSITLLAFAILFQSGIFSVGEKQFEVAMDKVEKQFIDQFKTTDDVVAIDRPKIEVEQGDSDQIFIAFNNKETTDKTFTIDSVVCDKLGGEDCSGITLEYKTTPTSVSGGDVTVLPINVVADSTTTSGTYVFDISISAGPVVERMEVFVDVV